MPTVSILADNGALSGSAGLKTSGGNDGVLQLQTTTAGGTATTAMSISNTQLVGVGVTPVASKGTLQVGTIGYTDTGVVAAFASSVAGYNQLIFQNTSNSASASANLNISNDAGTSSANYGEFGINSSTFTGTGSFSQAGNVYLAAATTDLVLGTYASKPIRFVVNSGATDAAIIDTSGNLGLGVTPSGWTLGRALQVGPTSALFDYTGTTYLSGNWYYGGGQKFITSGYAGQYQISTSDGKHIWTTTTASGTAGATATFSSLMTLDASGKLGIGATSPFSPLDINYDQETLFQIKRTTTTTGAAFLRFNNGGGNYYFGPDSSAGNRAFSSGGAAYGFSISTESAYPIVLGTNNTERARIDSSGYMRVGPYTPPNLGYVTATTNSSAVGLRVVGGSSVADGSIVAMIDKYSGTTSTSQWFLGFTISNQTTASGVITANGASQCAFGSWSDRRLKENIVDLPPQLDNIMRLRPVEFDYIESEGGGHQISFIAQEFEEVYPDAIGARPDGMKTLTGWSKTEARLVKAIQELKAEVDALKGQA